jgi:hypothetical protein
MQSTSQPRREAGRYVDTSLVDPAVVHLQGAVRQVSTAGPDPNVIGTLPPDARPDRSVYELVQTFWGTYADVVVTPAGQINLIYARAPLSTSSALVCLDGISYQP